MSNIDPFEELGLGSSSRRDGDFDNASDFGGTRRRDLRQPSTRRSRKSARQRAELQRQARIEQRQALNAPPRRPSAPAGKPRKSLGKRIATKLFSGVALALAAAFAVTQAGSLLLLAPTSAATPTSTTASSTINGQKLSVSSSDETPVSRDSFAALNSDELYDLTVTGAGYTVNNSGDIRWPFPVAVPLGDRFGERVAPCAGCSTFHRGTDFETGDKAPIYAVAAGVVTISEFDGSLGQYVAISHDVNGMKFTSIYGHMTAGSQTVKVGDTITEGEIIGLTGSTGQSTGPHLDFEINIDSVPVDSFVWLKKYTKH